MTEQKSIYKAETPAQVIESLVINGDLSKLTPEQRVSYYQATCKSLNLNPLTRPFDYITLNGKLTLYARKDAAEQLRRVNGISIEKPEIRFEDDWIIVTVAAKDTTGRTDSDVGVVNKKDMQGNFGNALMKAITKAKRRVTLSISGLGMLDETEVETIPGAQVVEVLDPEPEPVKLPDVEGPKMSFQTAAEIKNSEGEAYGSLDNNKLAFMLNAITKKLSTNLTPEDREGKEMKRDAILTLMYYRQHPEEVGK